MAVRPRGTSKRRRYVLLFLAAIILYTAFHLFFSGDEKLTFSQRFRMWRFAVGSHPFMTYGFTFINSKSAASYRKAEAYYQSQLPHFVEAAKNFYVHKYFTHTKVVSVDVGWFDLIGARLKAMGDLLRNERKDDFKIEKDKCEMTKFFILNKFPHCKVLKWYNSKDEFKQQAKDGAAWADVPAWPIFIKNCHLTQGSAKGTKRLKNAQSLDWLPSWVDEKW